MSVEVINEQGGGGKVITGFSDNFNRPNGAGWGPDWISGLQPLLIEAAGLSFAIAVNQGVIQSSGITAGNSAIVAMFPIPCMSGLRGNQFVQVTPSLTAVAGTAMLAGPCVLAGWKANGDLSCYFMDMEAVDAVPANNRWNLVRHNTGTARTVLATGANGSWPSGTVGRIEARVTVGTQTELKLFVGGVLQTTFVDNSASRCEAGSTGLGRDIWVGTGPIQAINFDDFSCGKL